MAGRKLTDLTTTATLANDDLVYVVDVSATAGTKSKGIAKSDLAALMGTSAAQTEPVENEYADISTSSPNLLADQGNQTTGFLQYVVDASADPNITSGEAYYEKLATSTGVLADDYRLLSDTEVTVVQDSNSYRVFRIQAISATPLSSVGGGRISFEYTGADVTAVVFNKNYTDAIEEFYGKDVNIRFYNRNTKKYQTEAIASGAWTTVNTDYYRGALTGTSIQTADLSVNNRVEFFIVEASAAGGGGDMLAANNLSDVANASTSRTNLGVAIGSDVQAWSAVLDATTASFLTADETKLDGIEALAEVNTINSTTVGEPTGSDVVLNVVSLTQAEYDAGSPNASTYYIITDAIGDPKYLDFVCSDETSDLATGTVFEKTLLRAYTNVSRIDFSVNTAPTGSTIIIDVQKNGTTVYSTKATIDATEFSTLTAATDQVLSSTLSFAAGDKIKVVIDQVGSTVAGVGLLAQMTYNT